MLATADIREAIVMLIKGVELEAARVYLGRHRNRVREAIADRRAP